jgi:hypothetical protein
MINTLSDGNDILAEELNENFQSIENVGFDVTLGETIDGNPAHKAVYLKNSDGKVYRTNAANNDERIQAFCGFLVEDGNADDVKKVRHTGIIDGFTGLTKGKTYYLAEAGSSDSDITRGSSGTGIGNTIGNDGGTLKRFAIAFTTTKRSKLTKLTIRVKKQNSPAGNLVCALYKGTPIGTGPDAGGKFVASASVAASSIGTSSANHDFNFNGVLVEAGTTYYLLLYHDTESSGNTFSLESDSSSGSWQYSWSSGSWSQTGVAVPHTIDFVNESFAAGEITDYFFSYAKPIGIAISDTEILLRNNGQSYLGSVVDSNDIITVISGARHAIVALTAAGTNTVEAIDLFLDKFGKSLATATIDANGNTGTVTAEWLNDVIVLSYSGGTSSIAGTAYFYA